MTISKKKKYPAFYNLLEVRPDSRPSVIKAAYLALMKEYHPDQEGADTKKAALLSEAFETLNDEKKKKKYDAGTKKTKGTVAGNYRILEEIAEGGFGTTYRGEHIIADEPVCIKHCHHISAAYQETLIEEAKAIWDLRHYSLPVMRDFLKLEDESIALVMSYIPGLTLDQLVKKKKRLSPETVAWISHRVLNALQYLHFHGVVHGDVKPQNIIVQEETHNIVIVDFGLSMVKPNRDSEAKGYTPEFASPEQLSGLTLVPESDFYSLGMTMLYALSGSIENLRAMKVPKSVPDELCNFFKEFLVRSPLARPNWKKDAIIENLEKIRLDAFGRVHSNLEPVSAS